MSKEISDVFGPECLDDKTTEQLVEKGIGSFDQKTKQYITEHLEKCAYCLDFLDLLQTKPFSEEEMKKYEKLTPEKCIEYCRNYVRTTKVIEGAINSTYPPLPKEEETAKKIMELIEKEKNKLK